MTEIRSYTRVWDLERRIYRIEGLRLNPGGIPVRGVCYLIAALAAAVIAARMPLLGRLAGGIPWYLLDVAFPVALATVLGAISIEGRPFHLAAFGLLRFRVSHLTRAGAERRAWSPEAVYLLADGHGSRLRKMQYDGPGAVAIGLAHELIERKPRRPARGVRTLVDLTAVDGVEAPQRRELVWLAPGTRLRVRATRRASKPA